MTVLPFRGARRETPLASTWRAVRGVPAASARLRLVRPGAVEGVADVALVLLGELPGALVTPRGEVARHG
jgi:hypothetical protein